MTSCNNSTEIILTQEKKGDKNLATYYKLVI